MIKDKLKKIGLAIGAAPGLMLLAAQALHAQVSYSSASADSAVSTVYTNVLDWFWTNVTPALSITIGIGIFFAIVYLVARRIGGGKKLR